MKTAMSSGDALVALINDVLGELALAALAEGCSCQRGICGAARANWWTWSQQRVQVCDSKSNSMIRWAEKGLCKDTFQTSFSSPLLSMLGASPQRCDRSASAPWQI